MILTIWRHGAAEGGARDHLRRLTSAGRDDVGYGSHRFHEACAARRIPHPHRILHSPLVRTVQTAEIIASAFTHALVVPASALQPGSNVAAVDAALREFMATDSQLLHILLVSHQPLISELVEHYHDAGSDVPFLVPGGLVSMSLALQAPRSGVLLFCALPPEFEDGM